MQLKAKHLGESSFLLTPRILLATSKAAAAVPCTLGAGSHHSAAAGRSGSGWAGQAARSGEAALARAAAGTAAGPVVLGWNQLSNTQHAQIVTWHSSE